jgi:hypothetical protein
VADWLQRVRESSLASAVTGGDEKGFAGRAHSQQAIGRDKGVGPTAGGRQGAEWLAGQALKPWRGQYLGSTWEVYRAMESIQLCLLREEQRGKAIWAENAREKQIGRVIVNPA